MGLTHEEFIVDVDATCVIDTTTRKIISSSPKNTLSQYDHNSERIGFTMPRKVDNHDMSKSDRVAIKYLNVRNSDMYIVDDMTVSEDGEFITFTWLVSGNATQEAGSLIFLVNFRCYADDGTITYNWSTQPCSTYSILKGVTSMDSNPMDLYDFWTRYQSLVTEVMEDAEDAQSLLRVLVRDTGSLEDDVNALTKVKDSLKTSVDAMSKNVPVLENKVKNLQNGIPNLESRVGALERTLDDDSAQAINAEISNIKSALTEQGLIAFDVKHGTSYSGNVTIDEIAGSRAITTEKIDCSGSIRIDNRLGPAYMYGLIYYESDGTWSNADPGWMAYGEYYPREYGYINVNFKKKDETELTAEDLNFIKANFAIRRTDLEFAKNSDSVEVKRRIDSLIERYDYHDYDIQMMGTISAGQIQIGSLVRCCTKTHIRVRPGMWVRFNTTDYDYGIACFDNDLVYDGVDYGWSKNDFYIDFEGYILMNFRTPTNATITDEDVVRIKEACYIENYIRFSDDVKSIAKEDISHERAISSISVEYGRYEGASYVFCRIPKTLNDGRSIVPKVRLTSLDETLIGDKRSTLAFARTNNSIFTVNAGLFDMTSYVPVGQTIIDGVSVTNTPMVDDNGSPISDTECYPLCIDANGVLSAPYERSVDTATMISDGVVQAITGWGKIVENFEIMLDDINAEIVHQGLYIRQSIGQFQNGDYCVCTVDQSRNGVENEAGITYEALAQLFVDRGVKFAYSLDGGGSAETVIGKRQLNPIYEGDVGRPVPTVITFEIAD